MDDYRKLRDTLCGLNSRQLFLTQGIVRNVHDLLCDVEVGKMTIPDVRLRASEIPDGGELLMVPQIGSAVTIGSLSGDMKQLVVLVMDKVAEVKVSGKLTINGGSLGGMVKIEELTKILNKMVATFNAHTHTGVHGETAPTATQMETITRASYEDDKITH